MSLLFMSMNPFLKTVFIVAWFQGLKPTLSSLYQYVIYGQDSFSALAELNINVLGWGAMYNNDETMINHCVEIEDWFVNLENISAPLEIVSTQGALSMYNTLWVCLFLKRQHNMKNKTI